MLTYAFWYNYTLSTREQFIDVEAGGKFSGQHAAETVFTFSVMQC